MEFVLVDRDGRSRDYFASRVAAIDHLLCEESQMPGITVGWMLQVYDDDGNDVGEPEWAESLLNEVAEPSGLALTATPLQCAGESGVSHAIVRIGEAWPADGYSLVSVLKEASCEIPPTIHPECLHQLGVASGRIPPVGGEMAQASLQTG